MCHRATPPSPTASASAAAVATDASTPGLDDVKNVVFVLADDRATARDSRALLDTEGGTLAVDDVLGRVVFVAWPPRGPVG